MAQIITIILDIIRNANTDLKACAEKIQTFINPPRHKSTFEGIIRFTPQQKKESLSIKNVLGSA
ncbi:hypothetical protein [Helicobacter turcicus]|uniref:Uncharacterized protein n=1 Tax=Helicobacter turcicus TaxID=2867412 RepID=A0ABS7JN76_9HELI|nr:hypothetical protein [Helicobacter turcicus]MBX7490852.1 hypothetical protein [Helicobacter turcicus]MBX7545706.1 hypothetical protein [Helicobacter turcicus]